MPIFDPDEARERRGVKLEQVTENAREAYVAAFDEAFAAAVREHAERGYITSDDVTGRIPDDIEPHHSNAIGALMRRSAIARGMTKGEYSPGARVSCHASAIAQWWMGDAKPAESSEFERGFDRACELAARLTGEAFIGSEIRDMAAEEDGA